MCRSATITTTLKKAMTLKKEDEWIATVDYEAFASDIRKLGEELEKNQGEADVKHLNKMIGWSNACAFLGLVTMGLGINMFSIVMLSTWTFSRWTMIAHHTCHGGYDKCHPNKVRISNAICCGVSFLPTYHQVLLTFSFYVCFCPLL